MGETWYLSRASTFSSRCEPIWFVRRRSGELGIIRPLVCSTTLPSLPVVLYDMQLAYQNEQSSKKLNPTPSSSDEHHGSIESWLAQRMSGVGEWSLKSLRFPLPITRWGWGAFPASFQWLERMPTPLSDGSHPARAQNMVVVSRENQAFLPHSWAPAQA